MDSAPVLHPNDPTLHSYSLGKLGDVLNASVVQHLERCSDCRRHLAEIGGNGALDRLGQGAVRLDETIRAESLSDYGRDSRSALLPFPAPCHRSWSITPNTELSASLAEVGWASSTWRTTD